MTKEIHCTVYTKDSPEGIELTKDERMEFDKSLLHRENNPAIAYADGEQRWYKNGKYHRLDGPAEVYADGEQRWWINDESYSEEDYWNHPLVIEYKIKQEITEALEGELGGRTTRTGY